MTRFKRRPIEVEAERFAPDDGDQHRRLELCPSATHGGLAVSTLEGDMHLSEGDWIVTGVLGERYPCKPEVFEQTFVSVESDPLVSTDWPRYRFRTGDRPVNQSETNKAILREVEGDLLDQDVDAIVNPWNRNAIPWWLLIPQGVSGAIKRKAGAEPFREIGRHGWIPLGGAVVTSAGCLPQRAIIHVAGINLLWRASEASIRASVANALQLAVQRGYRSLAMPLIGAGSGGFKPEQAKALILDQARIERAPLEMVVVTYPKGTKR